MTTNKDQSNKQPPVCDYEGSDYQSSFWDKGTRDYEDQVEAVAFTEVGQALFQRRFGLFQRDAFHRPRSIDPEASNFQLDFGLAVGKEIIDD